jgi:hypothetical protein
MALVKATLKAQIKAAFQAQSSKTDNPAAALDDLADQIATAVDAYIKSATITNVPALISPAGPVSGTITSTIS